MKIEFNKSDHSYKLDGSKIPSVTQIISELLPMQFKPDDWYLKRGSAVHAAASYIAWGVDFKFDDRIANQVEAIHKFFKEIQPFVIAVEQIVYSDLYRYAGRYDLLCKINNKNCLIDYKGSVNLERTALQLAAYGIITNIKYGYGVEIKDNGTYSMTECLKLDKWKREFLALRSTYAIRERLNLNKGGQNK